MLKGTLLQAITKAVSANVSLTIVHNALRLTIHTARSVTLGFMSTLHINAHRAMSVTVKLVIIGFASIAWLDINGYLTEADVFLMFVREIWFLMAFRVRARLEHILPTIHVSPANQTASGVTLTDVSNATMDTCSKINGV